MEGMLWPQIYLWLSAGYEVNLYEHPDVVDNTLKPIIERGGIEVIARNMLVRNYNFQQVVKRDLSK